MSQKLSAFWQIFYGRILKTTFYVSNKTLWGFSCENKLNFYLFWILAEETLHLLPKKYRRGCENCIPSVHRNISRGPLYEKNIILSLSDVVGELLDLFRKSIGGVVKFCNYVSIETVREKKFSQKNKVFQKKAEVQLKFFEIFGMNFGRAVKTACRVPVRNIFKKNTVSEKESFSSQFRKSSGRVFAFCWSFSGWGCQNCLLRVHWNVLRDLILPNYFLSFSIPDTELKSSCILWTILKYFDRIVKTAFQVSMGNYWGKFFQY